MNRWVLLAVIVALGGLIFVAYESHNGPAANNNPVAHIFQMNEEFKVRKITVLQGHEFDLTFVDGRRVHARLPINTPPEAKHKVVEYINNSRNPRCVVLDRSAEAWTVDLLFDAGSLTDWLRQQNLVWDN